MIAPIVRTARQSVQRNGLPALLICLLAIVLLTAITPGDDEPRRHYVDARIGQTAANREFRATVTRVQLGRAVIEDEYGQVQRTRDAYVVVAIAAQSPSLTVNYTGIELHTADGRSYRPRDEFLGNFLMTTQPGFGTRGVAVFELPADRVAGAQLIIGPDRSTLDIYATAIRVDLGLTDATPYAEKPIELPAGTTQVIR